MPSNEQRRATAKRKLERQIARRAEQAKRRRTIGAVVVLVVVVVVAGGLYLIATGGDDNTPKPLACSYPKAGNAAKPAKAPSTKDVSNKGTVTDTLDTSVGTMKLTLNRQLAPCTVNSFVSLSKQGYFDNTPCHRLTTSGIYVLQCGDPTGSGSGGPGYQFKDETKPSLKYSRGVLAMANSGPNTNGSQFFIVYKASQLPPNYTVFGSIDDGGLAAVDKVAKAGAKPTPNPSSGQVQPGDGPPKLKVTIKKATVQA